MFLVNCSTIVLGVVYSPCCSPRLIFFRSMLSYCRFLLQFMLYCSRFAFPCLSFPCVACMFSVQLPGSFSRRNEIPVPLSLTTLILSIPSFLNTYLTLAFSLGSQPSSSKTHRPHLFYNRLLLPRMPPTPKPGLKSLKNTTRLRILSCSGRNDMGAYG